MSEFSAVPEPAPAPLEPPHPIIQTVDLKKIYGMGSVQVSALNGISLTINSGEFVSIMGPSGSGKSTLMNILGCLDRPTEGQYILNGEDVSDFSRAELAFVRNRWLGFVFQSYNLLPRMNALENVLLPLMYDRENRVGIAEREERALAALEEVGLADRVNHLPRELSGGEQQRVAIARALINQPIMLLADEPTGNLDTHSSYEIMELLHRMNERGHTIVMVTHERDIAAHTQRIIHIRDGQMEKDEHNGHLFLEARASLREALKNGKAEAAS